MTDFHDIRFPLHLAFGASGGPVRRTTILPLASGREVRNTPHRHSKRRYNAVAGLKSDKQAYEIISFFEARNGPLHAFRFRDPLDNKSAELIKSTDQLLGQGDGSQVTFPLRKAYGDTANTYWRPVTKPVPDTVLVAVDGVTAIDVRVDYLTGLVTFQTPPEAGAIVTAGFEFDVPVRFANEALDIVLDDFGAMQIQDIPLIEVYDHV